MVTTGIDHNILDRSLMILENEHARTEDKVAACSELEGYFNHLSKNKTDNLSLPFKTHGEKMIKVLLQCLEKDNNKLRTPVLQVLKLAVQLLPKGLGLGMQVASHCYAVLLKSSQATEENVEPSCSRMVVELFRCMARFDDPQFVDAVMAANIGYSDHKVLIQKCVNNNKKDPVTNSVWKDQHDIDAWVSYLKLEALHFMTRLLQVCGSLLSIQFKEDLDFWLELLLPPLLTFREMYSSVLRKETDADIRKASREALNALLVLLPKDEQLKLEKWPKIKKDIKDSYSDKMVKLVGITPDWAQIWCMVLDVLGAELIRKGNNHLINKLLNVEERAFKYDRSEVRVQAFICWRHLIDKFLPSNTEVASDAVQRSVRLLVQPLQPNNAKTDIMSRQKLNTWWHLVHRLDKCIENHLKSVLVPFLVYCFGSAKSREHPPGKKFAALHIPCAQALAYILDKEPAKQQECEKRKHVESVEECIIHPCNSPLLDKSTVFLDVSEDLFYSVGECFIILSSRNEVEMCSQLLCTTWNFLLRHVALVLESNDIAADRVAKLIQDLLRLVQNLTERSSSTAPAMASHCISLLLEGLLMGPNALPPVVLASSAYYVGTAQLMTGTPALFLMEVIVSRPLLQLATSHSRYIPVLKTILDVGIRYHNVLEFMQSVMKQLEAVASSYYNVNSAERASLCIVWSNVATVLTNYLKDQNIVNQGNEKHHDLSCFYLVVLFPFYHLYSISYKQTMETLSVWLELYKSFHQAAVRSVPTLDINEVCEAVTLKISQALAKHCPTSANQAMSLLKAVQHIIMTIPYGDVCGTRQSSRNKSRYLLLPDRGRMSKPTNYIMNTMSLVVKVSQLFPMFEHSGEWYNTAGALIMSCLETLLKNMKTANVAAAIPMVSGLSDAVFSLLQVNPLQDGTTKFWHESLQRMWKCYFTFIETYLPQKSVKDFLGWMSALLEAGFKHPSEEIRNITITFWDNIVVRAFAIDNTSVPHTLKEARENCSEKCNQTQDISYIISDDANDATFSEHQDKGKSPEFVPEVVFTIPDQADKQSKRHQSLIQQLQDEGHILTKHQKEVFRRRKDDIPALYSSVLQPLQEDSIMSQSSTQDMSEFTAPKRIIEPIKSKSADARDVEESLITSSLKVLEPPRSLRRLADYRKKMMIDHEGSIVLASISGNNSTVNSDTSDKPISSDTPVEILSAQAQTNSDSPDGPLSLTFVSDPCEPSPPASNGRKLNLEFVAVRLPTPIIVPSKETSILPESQLIHEQDVSAKPEMAIRVSISTPAPTSVVSDGIDTSISFPLEEPRLCNNVIMSSNEQSHVHANLAETRNIHVPPMEVHEIVELPAIPITILAEKNVSPKDVTRLSKSSSLVPDSRNLSLSDASSKKSSTEPLQNVDHASKLSKRKPVVVNTGNPLTNYFKPVSITLTADDDEVTSNRKGSARTIHLSIETSDSSVSTTTSVTQSKTTVPNMNSAIDVPLNDLQEIDPKQTEILEDNQVTSVSSVEVSTTTNESNMECEVSDDRVTSSPLKVVVEKVEDFSLNKTFAALETMTPPFNIECDKESPHEVSSSSRRKTKSPLKRNPGDPKLPPFKGQSKGVIQVQKKEQLKEKVPGDDHSNTGSRCGKRKESGKSNLVKRPSRRRSGNKYGNNKDQMSEVTVGKNVGNAVVDDIENCVSTATTLIDNSSPSLLPAVSGRQSRLKTKQVRSKNAKIKSSVSETIVPQDDILKRLPHKESERQSTRTHKSSDSVKTNKRSNIKSETSSNYILNESKKITTKSKDSFLPAHHKTQTDITKCRTTPSRIVTRKSSTRKHEVKGNSTQLSTALCVELQAVSESMKQSCIEMQADYGKVEENTPIVNEFIQSTNCERKTKTDAKMGKHNAVEMSKSDISDKENNLMISKQDIMEPSQHVHHELLTSDVKTNVPCAFNKPDELLASVGAVIQNDTVPCFVASDNKQDACVLKEGQGDDSTKEKNANSFSGDKRDSKCVFPKVRLLSCSNEKSVLQEKGECSIRCTNGDPKLTRSRKSTSKQNSSTLPLEKDEKLLKQNNDDVLKHYSSDLNSTPNTLLGFKVETDNIHVAELEEEKSKETKLQNITGDSCIPSVSTKDRKRKYHQTLSEDNLNLKLSSSRRKLSRIDQDDSNSNKEIIPKSREGMNLQKNSLGLPKTNSKSGLPGTKSLSVTSIPNATATDSAPDVVETPSVLISTASPEKVPITDTSPGEESIHTSKQLASLPKEDLGKKEEPLRGKEPFITTETSAFSNSNFVEHDVSLGKIINYQKPSSRRSQHSIVHEKELHVPKRVPTSRQRKLRSSANKSDELVKNVVSHDAISSDQSFISSPKKTTSVDTSDVNGNENVINSQSCMTSTATKLEVEESDLSVLSIKQIIPVSKTNKEVLTDSVQSKEMLADSLQTKTILSCDEIQNTTTGKEEIQEDSQPIIDSEDVIESSQDSSAASIIVSRLPLTHKCTVSVCRIDTSLEPGAKIDVFQGDQKLVVLVPEDSCSPFKVYTPEKAETSLKQAKPLNAKDETHHAKLLAATRSLYGNTADVSQVETIQKKPDETVINISYKDENMKENVQKFNTSKSEDDVLNVSKTNIAKPKSKQIGGTLTCKNIVTTDSTPISITNSDNIDLPKQRGRKSNTPKLEETASTVVDTSDSRIRNQFNRSGDVNDTETETIDDTLEQLVNMTKSISSIPVIDVGDLTKLRDGKSNTALEDDVSSDVIFNVNPKSRAEHNTETEDDIQKSRLKLQGNITKLETNIRNIEINDSPKVRERKSNTLELEEDTSSVVNILDLRSKNLVNKSRDDEVEAVEDAQKSWSKQQSNAKSGTNAIVDIDGSIKRQGRKSILSKFEECVQATVGSTSDLGSENEIFKSGAKDNVEPLSYDGIQKSVLKQVNVTKSEVSVSVTNIDDPPKPRGRKSNTVKPEDVLVCTISDSRSKVKVNNLEVEHNIELATDDRTQSSHLKQQLSISKSGTSIQDVSVNHTPKLRGRKSNTQILEEDISHVVDNDSDPISINLINKSEAVNSIEPMIKECNEKSNLKQQVNITKSETNIHVNEPPKLRGRKSNAPKFEDSVSLFVNNNSEPRSRNQVNKLITGDNIEPVNENDIQKSISLQLFNTSQMEDGILMAAKTRFKQQINTSNSKDFISLTMKDDTLNYKSKQHVHISKSEERISRIEKDGISRPISKQHIHISKSEDNISKIGKENTPKSILKQSSFSKSDNSILTAVSEDVQQYRSKQVIGSKLNDSILIAVKEDPSKSRYNQQCNVSISEEVLSNTLRPRSKQHNNSAVAETTKYQCSKSNSTSKSEDIMTLDNKSATPNSRSSRSESEDSNTVAVREVTPKLKSKQDLASKPEERISIFNDDSSKHRSKHASTSKKINQNLKGAIESDLQVTKVISQSSFEKALNRDNDKLLKLGTRQCFDKNNCSEEDNKKNKLDNKSKYCHKVSSTDSNHKVPNQQSCSDKGLFLDEVSYLRKSLESNEINVSKGDSELAMQSRKRKINSSNLSLDVSLGQTNSDHSDSVDMVVFKMKRSSHNAENLVRKPVHSCSSASTPPKVKQRTDISPDSDLSSSPSSPKALLTSPSSLLRAFSSVSGNNESRRRKSHHRRSGGRAQYMVGLAVAVKDVSVEEETVQGTSLTTLQKQEHIRNVNTARPPAMPLSRKRLLYGISEDDTASGPSSLERLQSSVKESKGASPTCATSLADVPCKRTLKLSSGDQGTPPSKKKRVWFPDPEVSGTRLFSAYETVDCSGNINDVNTVHSDDSEDEASTTVGRRSCKNSKAELLHTTNKQDESYVSAFIASISSTSSSKEAVCSSQSSLDLSNVSSQGYVEEARTELMNSQDAFFPLLVNCNHPIECVAPRLTTHVMWTKALVVELTHKNIRTVGDLSRLDEASINRLPIANPKISHARAVLQEYWESFQVKNERPNSKGGGRRCEEIQLEANSAPSSSPLSESQRISTTDIAKFIASNKGSLTAVLEEASKMSQCSDRLNQEMLKVLKHSTRSTSNNSETNEESISEALSRFGKEAVLEHLIQTDVTHSKLYQSAVMKWLSSSGLENFLGKLPPMEIVKYIVKHNPDTLCKMLIESPAVEEKVMQNYLNSQLSSGKLCYKDLFDKMFSADWNNTFLNAMQSFLMLKKSTEEILHKMPVENVMQYATSRLSLIDKIGLCAENLMEDSSMEVPVNHYQKLVQAVGKKVTQKEFTTITYNVLMEKMSSK